MIPFVVGAMTSVLAAIGVGWSGIPAPDTSTPADFTALPPVVAISPQSVPTMVVLDASGAMRATDAPGSRLAAAKRAVTGLVGALPSGARVGLEVYGTSTGSSAAERAARCRDSKVVAPVGPAPRSSVRSLPCPPTARARSC